MSQPRPAAAAPLRLANPANTTGTRSASPVATVASSFGTSGKKIGPSVRQPLERILLAGDSYSGKSFAYFSLADHLRNEALKNEQRVPNFYIIDTNDTAPKMIGPGGEFEHLNFEDGGNVFPYPVFGWEDYIGSMRDIRDRLQMGDWIVVDLGSDLYKLIQQFLAKSQGKVLSDEVFNKQKGKIAGFESSDWNIITSTFEPEINAILNNRLANSIIVTHLADMIDVPGRNRRETMLFFDHVGIKPSGPQMFYQKPDTVIFLYAIRPKTGDTRSTYRQMQILKDRGLPQGERMLYDRLFFVQLQEYRERMRQNRPINNMDIAGAEAALEQNVIKSTENDSADN